MILVSTATLKRAATYLYICNACGKVKTILYEIIAKKTLSANFATVLSQASTHGHSQLKCQNLRVGYKQLT